MEKNPKSERPRDSDGKDSLKGVTIESLGTAPMMMTADEIATCLNISTRTVWRLKAKGDLPKSVKIHDYEGFGPISIHECHGVPEVSRVALHIEEHGDAFAAYVSQVGDEYATEESFQDTYHGHWDSELAYAEHIFDELYIYQLPEKLRYYIDYEAFSRDLFLESRLKRHPWPLNFIHC